MRNLRLYLISLICLSLAACAPLKERDSMHVLGTMCTIYIPEGAHYQVFNDIFASLQDIHKRYSPLIGASEITKVNENAGIKPVPVSSDIFNLLQEALYVSEISKGAFDPSLRPLIQLWGIGTEYARIPNTQEIETALELTGFQQIVLDEQAKSVYLPKKGMGLDLGAIAKGFAGDRIIEILEKQGIKSALIDLGGNILAHGKKPDGSQWTLGIQDPKKMRNEIIGYLPLQDKALVTSGVYERFFIKDDIRYHHLLDPKTGFPARSGISSVTIIAADSSLADGLSTALFVMGPEEGLKLIEKIPDTEALFVNEDGQLLPSSGFREEFTLTSEDYWF